jgi:hypothetical protein
VPRPRRLEVRVGIGPPGGDRGRGRLGLPLPVAAGLRDALGLLDGVGDLVGQDAQPALAAARPGRHEHAVPGRRRRIPARSQEGIGPRPGVQPDPAQVNGKCLFQNPPQAGVERRPGITEMKGSRYRHGRFPLQAAARASRRKPTAPRRRQQRCTNRHLGTSTYTRLLPEIIHGAKPPARLRPGVRPACLDLRLCASGWGSAEWSRRFRSRVT